MLSEQDLLLLRERLLSFSKSQTLPTEEEYSSFLDNSITTLESESPDYRPLDSDGNCGGLLDFSHSSLPVLVVPDLHGRYQFLEKLINHKIGSATVLELLARKEIFVVCVGDGVHSEIRGRDRWKASLEDYRMGVYAGPLMQQEMKENITTMYLVMELKNAFPDNFHFLKGNHENVHDQEGEGNHSFRKFALEGKMCRSFIQQVYGDVVLHLINCWEKNLPVCAMFPDCVITHAEPLDAYSRQQVIDYHINPDVVLGLTWTANDEAKNGSVLEMERNLYGTCVEGDLMWFGGHRPVTEKYAFRQSRNFIQIHNPVEMNFALVEPGKKFDPEKNIISLNS